MIDHSARLFAAIKDVCPLVMSTSIGDLSNKETWTFNAPGASAGELSDAATAVANFVVSDGAHAAWLEDQKPERKAIRQAAANAIAANDTYIALANPTAAQNATQIERLSQQMNAVIRRLIQLD